MFIKYSSKIPIIIFTVISIMLSYCLTAYANAGHISANAPETVNIGRSFNIVLSLESTEPVKSVWVKFKYDSEYISFSKVSSPVKADLYHNEDSGEAQVICLFKDAVKQSDIINITFTARTGNDPSTQIIGIELIDAVTNDLEKADISVDDSAEIYIERKSSLSQSDHVSRKNTAVSEKSTSSKKLNAFSNSNDSTRSNQNSRKYDTAHSIQAASDIDGESEYYTSSRITSERLYYSDNKIKYLLSGAGITIAVIGILFGVFKLGEAKSRSTYIVQNKTNDKDEEDKK